MSNANIKKMAPFALPKLQKFLDKFKNIFRRSDTMNAAERYMIGLMSDIPYKNCEMMAKYSEVLCISNLSVSIFSKDSVEGYCSFADNADTLKLVL